MKSVLQSSKLLLIIPKGSALLPVLSGLPHRRISLSMPQHHVSPPKVSRPEHKLSTSSSKLHPSGYAPEHAIEEHSSAKPTSRSSASYETDPSLVSYISKGAAPDFPPTLLSNGGHWLVERMIARKLRGIVLARSHNTATGKDELTFRVVSEPWEVMYPKDAPFPSSLLAPAIA